MVVKLPQLTKGQIYTLEAVAAVTLLITAIIFAQAASSVTPLSSSTASENVENQHNELANGIGEITNKNGELREALLYWDNDANRFHNSGGATIFYTLNTPENNLGNLIQEQFVENGIGVRIDLSYYRGDDYNINGTPYIDFGSPSPNASSSTTTIELYDNDKLVDENGNETNITLDESDYFMPNINEDAAVYNVVQVRVTIWRI